MNIFDKNSSIIADLELKLRNNSMPSLHNETNATSLAKSGHHSNRNSTVLFKQEIFMDEIDDNDDSYKTNEEAQFYDEYFSNYDDEAKQEHVKNEENLNINRLISFDESNSTNDDSFLTKIIKNDEYYQPNYFNNIENDEKIITTTLNYINNDDIEHLNNLPSSTISSVKEDQNVSNQTTSLPLDILHIDDAVSLNVTASTNLTNDQADMSQTENQTVTIPTLLTTTTTIETTTTNTTKLVPYPGIYFIWLKSCKSFG